MAITVTDYTEIPTQIWDISESIPELAYLTHNFFRYYGKFPSVLARKLIQEFAIPHHVILDNYAGSGTSLVEAKLAGYNSIGVDINPFAVLACRVKCRTYSVDELTRRWYYLSELLQEHYSFLLATEDLITNRSKFTYHQSLERAEKYLLETPHIDKWFGSKEKYDLAIIKSCILQLPLDEYREFFTLAFCAIIRRVSKAYDGEIRPHINKTKTPRPVWKAYSKKVTEMISREREWVLCVKPDIWTIAVFADNRTLSNIPVFRENPVGLIIAHPPYLNSFDYLPAYSLEFQWATGFHELWTTYDLSSIREIEIRAWPATNPKIYEQYFESQKTMFSEAFKVLVPGGVCCFVIGDSTIRDRLIPVHLMCAEIAQDIGFRLEQVIYRTTHYGVGKYAYNHRADYHDNENGKKDGVLILRKPA
jgi:DNA modification methylase